MSYEYSYAHICAQVNAALDPREVIMFLGWHPEKLVRSGDIYLSFCPIHRDEVFRTLELNPRNNTYECKHIHCPGNSPADLLDLVVKSTGCNLPEAILDLVDHFGPDRFKLNERQLAIVNDLATQIREYQERERESGQVGLPLE